MKQPIVITGEGIISAIGCNTAEVLDSLRKRRSGIGTMKYLHSIHREIPVGEVPLSNDDMRQQLGLQDESLLNRTTLMGMLAVRQALDDANISRESVQQQSLRLVLISGTTVAGMDVTEQLFSQLEQSDEALRCLNYHSAGSCTRKMADYFGIFAEYTTLSTACSSAANALLVGARMLQEGTADIVVAGGSEALSVFHLNGFNSLMILDHEPCRPFDATRAGLNLGEGAAYVVMETADLALRRGVKSYAYLSGYGNACDAFHQTASSDDGEGAYLSMTEALRMAQLAPCDIQYVNAHGTGTPNNDFSESVALKRVFGQQLPFVSSTKSFTGHTTSASGGIESVICLLALEHQFIPANLGWSQAMDDGIIPTQGEDHYPLQHVVCNSFGFGGNDTSLVFSLKPTTSLNSDPQCENDVKILSKVEMTSDDDLKELSRYVKPIEARRMSKLMRSSLLASLKALEEAGIEIPEAIVTGTAMGCLANSEQLLVKMIEEGEVSMSPTLFMQSTHNTISSNIAIRLGCHGYNTTYTQDEDSLSWALRDARQLLKSGRCKSVLVGCHDEATPTYQRMQERLGVKVHPAFHSIAIVLTCGK